MCAQSVLARLEGGVLQLRNGEVVGLEELCGATPGERGGDKLCPESDEPEIALESCDPSELIDALKKIHPAMCTVCHRVRDL